MEIFAVLRKYSSLQQTNNELKNKLIFEKRNNYPTNDC